MKGATAYEYQWGRFGIRIVHLTGGWFTWWAFWRRVRFQWFNPDQCE